MNYSLVVLSTPTSGYGARAAAQFANAAIARGHSIYRIFFLDDGVLTGSNNAVFPQDEDDRLQPWLDLFENHNIELVLCISSAIKRGMLDSTEATRFDVPAATVHPAFVIGGLGQLVDASAHCDRLVTFGG